MDPQVFCCFFAVVSEMNQRLPDLCRLIVHMDRIFRTCRLAQSAEVRRICFRQMDRQVRKCAADIFQIGAFLLTQDADAFAEILHLTDVSGPGIANQRFCGASGQSAQMTAGPLMLKMDVMLQQKRHIFLPFSERGKVQLQDIQAVQKILTEFSSGHGFPQVFVCGGDHADVYRDDRVIAQPYDLLDRKSVV